MPLNKQTNKQTNKQNNIINIFSDCRLICDIINKTFLFEVYSFISPIASCILVFIFLYKILLLLFVEHFLNNVRAIISTRSALTLKCRRELVFSEIVTYESQFVRGSTI